MNRKDLKILQQLDLNPRASIRQIGEKTLISKETVQYRIRRLEKEKIITGYWALPKISNSHTMYKVFLKSKGLSTTLKKEFEEYITNQDETAWFAQTTGSWSYIITLMSKDDWKISKLMASIFQKYSRWFSDIQLIKAISATSLNEKYIFDKPPINPVRIDFLEDPADIDEVESKIISLLTKNSRYKYTELAKKLGLTAEAISHRVKNIFKKGAIKDMKVRINHAKLGYSYYHLMLNFSDGSVLSKAEQYFIQDSNSVFTMKHVGKYQLHAEIVCKPEEINLLLNKFLDKFSDEIADYDLCKIEKEFKIKVNQ